jgi:Phage tail tube protein
VPAFFVHAGVSSLDCIGVHPIRPAAIINAIGQGETRFGTTQGGTPTSLTFNRISQFQGSIKRAGNPCGNLTGGSVTYSNNLDKIETIRDDGLIEGADPTIAALTGRIDLRFADTTLIDLAPGGTPVDLEFRLHALGAGKARAERARGLPGRRWRQSALLCRWSPGFASAALLWSGTWRSIARSSELAAWRISTERGKRR